MFYVAIGSSLLGLIACGIGRKIESALYAVLAIFNCFSLFGYMVISNFDPHMGEVTCPSPPCGGPVGH